MLGYVVQFLRVVSAQRGQTLAEYSLIIGLIAVGVVVPTVFIFQQALTDVLNTVSACLQDLPQTCVLP